MTKFGNGAKPLNSLFKGDGPIELDSEPAKILGFTSDKFSGWLWKKGRYIYISYIESKQEKKGHLSSLFKRIQSFGFGIKVPTPFARMESIVRKKGFRKTLEPFREAKADCEVWVLDPRQISISRRLKV